MLSCWTACVKNGQVVEAIKVFQEMEDKTLGSDIVIYSILIDGLCNLGILQLQENSFIVYLRKDCNPMFELTP